MRTPTRLSPRSFRPSLHAELTAHIRNMILHHELKPDDWVEESELCETLGVSRTPMREALKVLAAEKLVEIHPNRGARVASLSPKDVDDVFEAQAIIEGTAARLACERATEEEIEQYGKKQSKMVRAFQRRERMQYFSLNQELHLDLLAMSHNDALAAAHASIFVQAERARYLALDVGRRWADSVEQHENIFSALASGDGELAAKLVEEHIMATHAAVKKAVELQHTDKQERSSNVRRRSGQRET